MGHSIDQSIQESSLYRSFALERESMLKHKWLESERLGHDVGFQYALTDWIINHRMRWRKNLRIASETGIETLTAPVYLQHKQLSIAGIDEISSPLHKKILDSVLPHIPKIRSIMGTYLVHFYGVLQKINDFGEDELKGNIILSSCSPSKHTYTLLVENGRTLTVRDDLEPYLRIVAPQ